MRSRRIWLGFGLYIIAVIIISVIIVGVKRSILTFGFGPYATLETYVIVAGFGIILFIVSSIPALMVLTYQRDTETLVLEKIVEDLYLCGIREKDLDARLDEFMAKNSFGAFIVPALVNLLLLFILWSLVFAPNGLSGIWDSFTLGGDLSLDERFQMFDGLEFTKYLAQNASMISWAFLGAYFYILSVLGRRFMRADLTTGIIWKLNSRVIVAIVIALLLTNFENDLSITKVGAYIAFVAGIFPDSIFRWISDKIKTIFRVQLGDSFIQISQLQKQIEGISFWQADRLSDEGIDTVQNLATKEIPTLLVNTRFDTQQLLHWIDQALLVYAVGDDNYKYFRGTYINTASDFFDDLESGGGIAKIAANLEHIEELSSTPYTKPSITKEMLESLRNTLEKGPNLAYIRRYWANTSEPSRKSEILGDLTSIKEMRLAK